MIQQLHATEEGTFCDTIGELREEFKLMLAQCVSCDLQEKRHFPCPPFGEIL
jgi:hypothetical protein